MHTNTHTDTHTHTHTHSPDTYIHPPPLLIFFFSVFVSLSLTQYFFCPLSGSVYLHVYDFLWLVCVCVCVCVCKSALMCSGLVLYIFQWLWCLSMVAQRPLGSVSGWSNAQHSVCLITQAGEWIPNDRISRLQSALDHRPIQPRGCAQLGLTDWWIDG